MDEPMKVVVCGPQRAGKSTICNFLAQQSQRLEGDAPYAPTAGVRILETEKDVGRGQMAAVQIWDVAGNQSFENCWPAIMADVDGVVLVYDPGNPSQEQEIGMWYDYFVRNTDTPDDRVMAYVHSRGEDFGADARRRPHIKLENVSVFMTDARSESSIEQTFGDFVRGLHNRRGK